MSPTHDVKRMPRARLRRSLLRATAFTAVAAMLSAALSATALAQDLPRPKGPIAINIVDVAGDLALTQAAFELYAKKHPDVVSKFTFTKATAPEMPGELKAR